MRAVILAAVLSIPTLAQAGIINGDFETGDLTGWTYANAKNYGEIAVELDPEGGYHAALRFEVVPQIKSTSGAIIEQVFTVDARSDVSFDLLGQIDTDGDGVRAAADLGTIAGKVISAPAGFIGVYGDVTSVDQTFTYRVEAGTYRMLLVLGSALNNTLGTYAEGSLFLDNVTIVEVPEPASLLLALMCAGILAPRFFSRH